MRAARLGVIAVPCLGAGVLVGLSVPPGRLWELGIAGLGLLAWRLHGLAWKARLLGGLCFGLGLFGLTLSWATAFSGIGYVLLVVLEAAFFGLACVLVPREEGRALAFPAALTLAGAARGAWPFGGFPMGGIPLGQVGGPLLGLARVGGPLLVSGLAALSGVCLAELVELLAKIARWRRFGVPTEASWWRPLAAGMVVAGAVAASVGLAPDGGPPLHRLRVALVQGGGIRGLRAVTVNPEISYVSQLRETLRLKRPVSLILWPEDTVALSGPLAGTRAEVQIASLAETFDATLVAGVTEAVGATRFRNLAVAWSPSGAVIASYEKVHRVPFGEYVPGRAILSHLVNLSDVPRDAIPGHGPGLLHTPAGPLGVMISYEVFFAGRARAAVQAGGQLLVVPTNTSSYASDLVPSEEEAADRLRSVEEGRDLIQASPTGYSTVLDNRGAVRERSGLGGAAVVQAVVSLRSGLTLYERGGDTPVLALAVACLLFGWCAVSGQRVCWARPLRRAGWRGTPRQAG